MRSLQKANRTDARLTERDRAVSMLLAWLPLASFFLTASPLPLYFLIRYFGASQGAGEYLLLAFVAALFGSILGFAVALSIFIYRRIWMRRLRERLASDGITADELDWFKSQLTAPERRSLKAIERRDAPLADAYRETLAARLTAAQVQKHAKRELRLIEKRLSRAAKLRTPDAPTLVTELREDRARLQRIEGEAQAQRAEAETRLQQIEAAFSRAATESFTAQSLDRLNTTLNQTPLALESARLAREVRASLDEEARSALEKASEP